MDLQDLLGHELLQAPEAAILDAVPLQLADGVEEILGARTKMPAGARQHMRNAIRRLPHPAVKPGGPDPETQRPQPGALDIDGDPAHRAHPVGAAHFPSQQTAELLGLA